MRGIPLPPQQPLHFARIRALDRMVAAKGALALLALLLEVVALHGVAAQDPTGAGELEALLRRLVGLLLRAHFRMIFRCRGAIRECGARTQGAVIWGVDMAATEAAASRCPSAARRHKSSF